MMRFKPSRMTLAVVLAVAAILAAGGVAVASNMGFKLNKPISQGPVASAGNENWTSVPYNNPYGSTAGFCAQTGLKSSVITGLAQLTYIRPIDDIAVSCTCGGTCTAAQPLPGSAAFLPGIGFRIKQPGTGSTSIIIVGSHNPTLSFNIIPFCNTRLASGICSAASVPLSGQGITWLDIPYHTTAVTFKDLCTQMGLPSSALSTCTLSRVDAVTGASQNATCVSSAASLVNLVLGESVKVTCPAAVSGIIPAHF